MKRVRSWLTVGLLSCLSAGSIRAQAPSTRTLARGGGDSVLVYVVMSAVLGTLGGELAEAARDTTEHAWQIQMPASDSVLWRPYRDFLWRTLHARNPTVRDSAIRTISIATPKIRNDTLTVAFMVGGRRRCGEKWVGSTTDYEAQTVRHGALWEGARITTIDYGDTGPCGS